MSRPRRRFGEKKVEGAVPTLPDDDDQEEAVPNDDLLLASPDPLDVSTPTQQAVTFPSLFQHTSSPNGIVLSDSGGTPPASSSKAGEHPDVSQSSISDYKRGGALRGPSSFRKRQFGKGIDRHQDDSTSEALSMLDKFAELEMTFSGSGDNNNASDMQQQQQLLSTSSNNNNNPMDDEADDDGGAIPVQILRKGGSPGSLKSLRKHQPDITNQHNNNNNYSPQRPQSTSTSKSPLRGGTTDTALFSSSPSHQELVDVPSEIRCPVCLDGFHEPVTLLCNHNVCKEHILDLACQEEGFTKPSEEFEVRCPKCRVTTHFPNGEASVKVNHEMNAVVTMMMNLLAQRVAPPLPPPPPSVPPLAPRPASQGGGGGGRAKSSGRKAVSFNDEGNKVVMLGGSKDGLVVGPDGTLLAPVQPAVALPPLESALKRNAAAEGATASPSQLSSQAPAETPAAVTSLEDKKLQKAQRQLEGLEKQLEAQRERHKSDREEAARQKVLDYKRARQEEIDRRREDLMREMQAEEARESGGGQSPRSPHSRERSPALDDRVWSAAEQTLQKLKGEREKKRELEREAREKAIREGVQEWTNKGSNHPEVSLNGSALEKHLRAMADFESGGNMMNMSQKAREAEEKIMHMYKAPTTSEKERRNRPPTPEQRDVEVEQTLWQVEQRIRMEQEAELTRAQMADIAEQRARELISQFASRSGSTPKAPLKPSYVPKLNRLQKF